MKLEDRPANSPARGPSSPARPAPARPRLSRVARVPRRLASPAVVALMALAALPLGFIPRAHADEPTAAAGPRVAIIGYDSESNDSAEVVAKGALPTGWGRSDSDAFRATLRAEKATSAPGKAFATIPSRQAFAGRLRRAAKTAGVDAAVVVRSVPQPGGSKVDVMVVSVDRDTPALDATYLVSGEGPEMGGATGAVQTALRGLPANARVPAAPSASAAPEPVAAPVVAPAPIPDETTSTTRPPYLVVAIGGETAGRFLHYKDALTPALSNYDLGASPAIVGDLEVRPLAASGPALAGFALHGEGHLGIGLKSTDAVTGDKRSTTWTRWAADLRWRYGVTPTTFVGASAGVLNETFKTKGATLAPPNVSDMFVRLGLDARIGVGPVAILAQGAYLLGLSGGEVPDRMRDASFGGVEGGLGVGVPIGEHLEIRAQGLYTRVFYSFKPVPGDAYVAGGALDQMVRGQLMAAARF